VILKGSAVRAGGLVVVYLTTRVGSRVLYRFVLRHLAAAFESAASAPSHYAAEAVRRWYDGTLARL